MKSCINDKQDALIQKWAQIDALGEHLSVWPEDLSYDKVLEMIRQQDEEIIVHERVEDYPPEMLIEMIETMRSFHVQNFTEIYVELKNAE